MIRYDDDFDDIHADIIAYYNMAYSEQSESANISTLWYQVSLKP